LNKETRKQRLKEIEERYGEDIADAISMALDLFEDPFRPEVEPGGEDPGGGSWGQEMFVMAAMWSMDTAWLQEKLVFIVSGVGKQVH